MSRRPEKVLRWAWSPSTGASLEPPASDAAAGWATGAKPAAQHMNALLNNSGAWIDFLRGPSLNRWSRVTTGATLLTANLPVMAADRISVNTTTVRRRVVVAGEDSTGLCVLVSRRGDSWTLRRNFPGGLTGHFSRIYCLDAAWYLLVDDTTTGALLRSPHDGETGTALDGGADWTADSDLPNPGGVDCGLLAAASATYGDLLVARRKQLLFTTSGSGSWTTLTSATGGGGYPDSGGAGTRGTYSDVAYDGSWYVAISTHGDVVGAVNPSLGVATRERITLGTGLPWRLAVGASGELVAWLYVTGSSQPFYRSTDHGSSWERLDPTDTTLVGLTSLTYADGLWVASSTAAPYVWSSSDLVTWTPAVVPYVDADAQSVYGMALSEGGWVAARTTTALVGARGEDPSGGAWSTDPTPTTLGNAGWLTGRRVSSTAPTSGQVLTWSAGTSQWVPADSAGGSSPTTTAGDMIYRGASVDQRLAIGTSGQVLRVSAGAPAWGTLAASDVGAVAAPGSASTGDVLRWSGSAWASYALAASDVGAVPTSLTITAGTGLTGGGDLSTGRTLAVSFGTSSSTACVGDDARLSDTRTPSNASVGLAKLNAAVLGLVETTVTLPIAPGQHAAPTSGAEVIGLVYLLPSRYAVTGLTTTLTVEAIGYVESGCTLTLDVLDVTSGFTGASSALGAAVTWTETDPTRKTASITLPGSGKIYAAKISKNTSAGAYLGALNLLVDRS